MFGQPLWDYNFLIRSSTDHDDIWSGLDIDFDMNNTTCYLFDDSQQSMPPVMSTCTGATTKHTSTQAPFVSHHNVLTTGVYYNAPPTSLVKPQNNLVTTTGLAAAGSIISTSSNSSTIPQMEKFLGLTSTEINDMKADPCSRRNFATKLVHKSGEAKI